MKFGLRKPSWKKSLKARTTGKWKRAAKRAVIPWYGKRGAGLLHPKRAMYNRIYRRTTFSVFDAAKFLGGGSSRRRRSKADNISVSERVEWQILKEDMERRISFFTPTQLAILEERYANVEIKMKRVLAYWLVTGIVGGHRFYLHDYIQGALMALFFAYAALACGQWWGCIWWLLDFLFVLQRVSRANLTAKRDLVLELENEALYGLLRTEQPETPPPTAAEDDLVDTSILDDDSQADGAATTTVPEAEKTTATVGIEQLYPPDTEKFTINAAEKTFLRELCLRFAPLQLPMKLTTNRMSDGTLNVEYDGKQIGRVRLQKRKHFMQILTRDDVELLNGELPLFLENLPRWMDYVKELTQK
jgi:TM2 domain-containing membrane protein YozV